MILLQKHFDDCVIPSMLGPSHHEFQSGSIPNQGLCHTSQLPTEILRKIFADYLRIYSPLSYGQSQHRSRIPFVTNDNWSDPGVLAQVSSEWRTVALGYPALWSRIMANRPFLKSHVLITKLWLERAKGHPLDLILALEPNNQFAVEILQYFFVYSSTWKSIWLEVYVEDETTSFDTISRTIRSCEPCSNLECASVNALPDPEDFPLLDEMWRFFRSSPVLRKVTLSPFIPTLFPQSLLTRLTSVFLSSDCTIADLVLVIFTCPLLEEVETDYLSRFYDPVRPSTITHRNLQRLLINAESEGGAVFAGFTLPSLKSLYFMHTTPPFATFQDFLCRSKCRLQELTFKLDGHIGELEMFIQLEELRSLAVFRVSGAQVTDRAIELLLQRNGDSHCQSEFLFLPRLEVLHLSEWQASDGMLSRFFFARSCIPSNPNDMEYPDQIVHFPTNRGLAFSFWPTPAGPVDSAFLQPCYDLATQSFLEQ